MYDVIRNISRPDPGLVNDLAALSPATIHEAQGRKGAVDWRIKPIYSGMTLCGPVVTALCHPGDNLMLIAAIEVARPGDVLVVASGGLVEQGGFGEVLATACKARGLAGFVTDACVRDGPAIKAMAFPVFSRGLAMRGTVKETVGTINHPIAFGGILVTPGDVICGDDDGLVLVRPDEITATLRASHEREAKEAASMAAFRNDGKGPIELTGLDKRLAERGCTYEPD
jgi:4-hydroxy-4-methyl-2-oxoglutarate aldolase